MAERAVISRTKKLRKCVAYETNVVVEQEDEAVEEGNEEEEDLLGCSRPEY